MADPIRVLNLEDCAPDAELLLNVLQTEWPGLVFTVANDEQGFLAGLRAQALDVIIADYRLPGFDGLRALKLAREERPEVPFIFCSGTIGEDFAIETLRLGATDYVLKSRLGRLIPAIRRALREAVEVRERHEAQEQLARILEAMRRLNAELEARVRERTAALEAANQELEAFSYSVSHDLRAPLRAIEGFTAILLDEEADRLSGKGKEFAARIANCVEQMSLLIEDLLKLSRVGRAEMKRELVDLSALAHIILGALVAGSPERHVRTEIGEGTVASGDPGLLRILCVNLLENAWKFTRHRDDARVEFGARELEGKRVFFVRDNGAGFDMARAGQIFQPFQRLHKASEYPGTGIGLAIAARIVARHGGRIWAESAPGAGATFSFTLGQ